jgi:plastocyanin
MRYILALILLVPTLVIATENEVEIKIKNHKFEPAQVVVPAGKKIKLLIENQDATPEEFESHELNREKVIAGNSSTTIYVGPLDSGSYGYFGEFNAVSAQGVIVAK